MRLLLFCLFVAFVAGQTTQAFDLKHVLKVATEQYDRLVGQLRLGHDYPIRASPLATHWVLNTDPTVATVYWVDGFFPGVLWQLYRHTGNHTWRERAQTATHGLLAQQYNQGTHDVGFLVMCSFGEQYEATNDSAAPAIIVQAAHSLAARFNSHIGCTRSQGALHETRNFKVIVDNMMNLELLVAGARFSGNATLLQIAVSHANRTAAEHIRADHSSFHVVDFNQTDGSVVARYTGQGYSNGSCWSRGQAWLVTGFTRMYGHTGEGHFLMVAKQVSDYFIAHLPEDGVPWWDFDAPREHNHYVPRDVSAAAIACVGLFELYGHTRVERYLAAAHRIVRSLATDTYLVTGNRGYHLAALLANSTISKAHQHADQADQALPYADYYYLKALHYLRQYPIKA